ncbi:uncharacterized protein LOC133283727 [Gastrolobium bilobum]|uniref:uncharacterized protein LOC133283727 n=1 Tax=Gastrolobium bilobum TaxID=150636 RepID=UPI002AB176BE|nr:uncharacterized protein LOC133283727 [Gastrolobium bilobum]
MWKCLRNNQISAQDQDHDNEGKKVEKIKTSSSSSKLETARREDSMKKKVRFKIQDDRGGEGSASNSTSDPVRIRLVVTKEELKRMLSYKNVNDAQLTSLGQLLSDMKLREKTLSQIEENDGSINSWRPALESIPEDCSMK